MDKGQIIKSAVSVEQISARMKFAEFTANCFLEVGTNLHLIGHFIGDDRRKRLSPFEHGNDETVAISMLLRIGSQLVSGSASLIASGQHYAGASLIRQLVEVEYLAWAFETKNQEASRWLRSTRDERKDFFTPAKLRKAAGARFRSLDYSYHCELGGHPVPISGILLSNNVAPAQLMLADCLGHSSRIWDHMIGWAKINTNGFPILEKHQIMGEKYSDWKKVDNLTNLLKI